jgi:hypothetical protein
MWENDGDPPAFCTLWTEGSYEVEPWNYRTFLLPKNELGRSERENIMNALETAHGKIFGADGAAAILGMKPTSLASRMNEAEARKEISVSCFVRYRTVSLSEFTPNPREQ